MDETKKKEYKDWTEIEHPIWGKGGREEDANKIVRDNTGNDIERFATLEEAKIHADNQPI